MRSWILSQFLMLLFVCVPGILLQCLVYYTGSEVYRCNLEEGARLAG